MPAQFKLFKKSKTGWTEVGTFSSVKALQAVAKHYRKHDLSWGAYTPERGLATRFYIETDKE